MVSVFTVFISVLSTILLYTFGYSGFHPIPDAEDEFAKQMDMGYDILYGVLGFCQQ